jgi:tRNA pseudouridine13 synthase
MLVTVYYSCSMKLKQLPKDFIVEEITNIRVTQEKDDQTIFLMEKTGIDTYNAIHSIAKKLHIPQSEIGYAGLKDKPALTRQYISIPEHYKVHSTKIDALNIQLVGYYRKKIKIGDLKGNKFTIIVHDVKNSELDDVFEIAKTISRSGVPNYFDSQRFGSVIKNEFIAKYVVKNDYEQAVKLYLTACFESEPRRIRDEKCKILGQWDDLCNVAIGNEVFAKIIKEYLKTKSWLAAYEKIPARLREMFVNAYQSYIWNECIKEVLKTCVNEKKLYSMDYAAGSLIFYETLSENEIPRIPPTFRTVSDKAIFSDFEKQIIDFVLLGQGIKLADLDIESETGSFFKSNARPIIVIPENFFISNPSMDKLNNIKNSSKFEIKLSFSLPKGSYATIVTKHLFGN